MKEKGHNACSECVTVDTNTIMMIIQRHILVQQHVLVSVVLLLISDSACTHIHMIQQMIPLMYILTVMVL